MTEISIYGKYKVKCEYSYSYITDKIGDEYVFDSGKDTFASTMDGATFIDHISYHLKRPHSFSVSFADNRCIITLFNPNTGESETIHYSWEEIKKEEDEKQ